MRCIYHGWKFDVAGNCIDMPSLPPPGFKEKIKAWFREISVAGANLESSDPQQKAKAAMDLNRLISEDLC